MGFQLLYPGFGFLFGASSPAKLFAVAGAEFHSGWLRIVADFAKFSGGFCENLRILRCFLRNLADFAKSGGFCDFFCGFCEILQNLRNLADFVKSCGFCEFLQILRNFADS